MQNRSRHSSSSSGRQVRGAMIDPEQLSKLYNGIAKNKAAHDDLVKDFNAYRTNVAKEKNEAAIKAKEFEKILKKLEKQSDIGEKKQ